MWATGSARHGGFTLLELLVVLGIVSAMATLFPMALDRATAKHRVEASARELSGLVKTAALSARQDGQTRRFYLDAQGKAVIARDDGSEPIAHARSFHAPATIRAAGGEERLSLFGDGTSSGGVIVVTEAGRAAQLRLSLLTSRVFLEREGVPQP